ncbi:cytochrome P450 [Saccharopolyspora cebuensis]|uniref:Cytochrome P450 n=1 Tax=Saccharopolyspora cebuensis TaxID=418759 RepID=A0ABV4CLB6_9PSEU
MTSAPPAQASAADTVRAATDVLVPILAQGVIARRPAAVRLAGRVGADRRTVRFLQRMRDRYGDGPLRLRVPGRSFYLLLAPRDVARVLAGSPDPFALDAVEKRAALRHFQPRGVLISPPEARPARRGFNEAVLDTGAPVHHLAGSLVGKIEQEARQAGAAAARRGAFGWDDFAPAWRRAMRRVLLGDGARDDTELTRLLEKLRRDANWAYAKPARTALRHRFDRRLAGHLDRAEPGSLAGLVAGTPAAPGTDPAGQVPHWLFASDPAGMATVRALALLASHDGIAARVRAELADRDLTAPQDLPLLRACVLESVRLWPTTAVVLRDSTSRTRWDGGALPEAATALIISSFFHRDERTVPQAHRFDPDAWLDGRARRSEALVPFSAGPGTCPARELVLYSASTFLAVLLRDQDFRLRPFGRLDPARPLPYGLNPFALRFTARARD